MQRSHLRATGTPGGTCARRIGACVALVLALAAAAGLITPGSRAGAGHAATPQHRVYLPLVLRPAAYRPSAGTQFFAWDPVLATKARDAGTDWLRVPLYWSLIEPDNRTPDQYQWNGALDAILAEAHQANMHVILTLKLNPDWAATYSSGPIDLADIGELVEFVTAVVARYSVEPYGAEYLEVYNEPDNGDEWRARNGGWGFFGYQPDEYVRILSAIYAPIKATNPDVQVVFGGLAYDGWDTENPPGPFVESFLDNVLLAGGGAFFDIMNFHYFPVFAGKWAPYGVDIIGKVTYLREKMASYGIHKPVLCTETSMWSDANHGGSDELQSRYVAKVFSRSAAAGLRATTWFMLVDDPDPTEAKYGLLNPDLSPKPAHAAFQTWAERMPGSEFVRTLDLGQTGSPYIEAHEFLSHGDTIVVAWTSDGSAHPLSLAASSVTAVDMLGVTVVTVYDSDDGLVDYQVWIDLGPNPLYLYPAP
jgi:hypothetical protein